MQSFYLVICGTAMFMFPLIMVAKKYGRFNRETLQQYVLDCPELRAGIINASLITGSITFIYGLITMMQH